MQDNNASHSTRDTFTTRQAQLGAKLFEGICVNLIDWEWVLFGPEYTTTIGQNSCQSH